MHLVLILVAVIIFIVFATSRLKLNPFITLLLASFLAAFAFGLPLDDIEKPSAPDSVTFLAILAL